MKPNSVAGLFALVGVILIVAVFSWLWFFAPYGPGQRIEHQCSMSITGEGLCLFTNLGSSPGTSCIIVKLANDRKESQSVALLCSGRVWPNETAEKHFAAYSLDVCQDHSGQMRPWSQVCHLDISDRP